MGWKPSHIRENFGSQGKGAVFQIAAQLWQHRLQAILPFSPDLFQVEQGRVLSALHPYQTTLLSDELDNGSEDTEITSSS